MKKKGSVTAFYVESLILIVIVTLVILVITKTFGLAHERSQKADKLTEAVTMAENAAEALASDNDRAHVEALLASIEDSLSELSLGVEENLEAEGLVRYDIRVYDKSSGQTVYDLSTTVCRKEAP